jgi:hypothetical protein
MKLEAFNCDETWCKNTYEDKKMQRKQNIFLKQRLGNSSSKRWKEIVMDFETKIILYNDLVR